MDIHLIFWVIIQYYFIAQLASLLSIGDSSRLASCSLWHASTMLLFENFITFWPYKILKVHLYNLFPWLRVSHFFKDLGFLFWRMKFSDKDLDYTALWKHCIFPLLILYSASKPQGHPVPSFLFKEPLWLGEFKKIQTPGSHHWGRWLHKAAVEHWPGGVGGGGTQVILLWKIVHGQLYMYNSVYIFTFCGTQRGPENEAHVQRYPEKIHP